MRAALARARPRGAQTGPGPYPGYPVIRPSAGAESRYPGGYPALSRPSTPVDGYASPQLGATA